VSFASLEERPAFCESPFLLFSIRREGSLRPSVFRPAVGTSCVYSFTFSSLAAVLNLGGRAQIVV